MKVKEIMTRKVESCVPETALGIAARAMEKADCGALPVVRNGKTIGIITDRDICLALAQKDSRPSDLKVGQIMSRGVYACREEDDVARALKTMGRNHVRRLPVVDRNGKLRGILSMDDVALHALEKGEKESVSYRQVVEAFQAICAHRVMAEAV